MTEEKLPSLLIGMPVLNRARTLEHVLKAILNADYPKKLITLVFVDGGSNDGTIDILRSFSEENRNYFKNIVAVSKKSNIPQARNECLSYLDNLDAAVFLDSDVLIQADSIRILVAHLKRAGIASLAYSTTASKKPLEYVHDVPMGCTIISRSVVKAIGSFNQSMDVGEDTEYCLRAGSKNIRVLLDSTHSVTHLHKEKHPTLAPLARILAHRRVYAIIASRSIYRRRFVTYAVLDVFLLAALASWKWYLTTPVLAYLLAQIAKRRSIQAAFVNLAGALIIAPATLIGYFENRRTPHE